MQASPIPQFTVTPLPCRTLHAFGAFLLRRGQAALFLVQHRRSSASPSARTLLDRPAQHSRRSPPSACSSSQSAARVPVDVAESKQSLIMETPEILQTEQDLLTYASLCDNPKDGNVKSRGSEIEKKIEFLLQLSSLRACLEIRNRGHFCKDKSFFQGSISFCTPPFCLMFPMEFLGAYHGSVLLLLQILGLLMVNDNGCIAKYLGKHHLDQPRASSESYFEQQLMELQELYIYQQQLSKKLSKRFPGFIIPRLGDDEDRSFGT